MTKPAADPLDPPAADRLRPPRRHSSLVERPRLLDRMRSGAQAPVILLQAPAGYGKSTLAAQFAEADPRPVAWLALEHSDEDPVVLLRDLAHALAGDGEPDADLLTRLRGGPAAAGTKGLARLLAVLEAGGPRIIVVDDAHRLTSPEALDVLHELCEHLPSGCALVLAARRRPRVPLARLRTQGRLWELRADDLRMTEAEGAAMLRGAGADVDDREAGVAVRRTEGWAAALYLAGVLLRDGEAGLAPSAEPGLELADYFREEVLAALPADEADLLVRTAVLDELRPEICDAVLGRGDSARRLGALADADLFVTARGTEPGAYRIHALFREMLLEELRRRDPGAEPELRRRAFAAYREAGDWERAMHQAVAAGEEDAAAELLWALAPWCHSHGQTATLERWYSWLGPEAVRRNPQAALAHGWCQFTEGRVEEASDAVALALGAAPGRVLPDGSPLEALALVLRAAQGLGGTDEISRDAEAVMAALPANHDLRPVAQLMRGSMALLAGEREEAATLLADAESASAGTMPSAYTLSLAQQAVMSFEDGEADLAAARARRACAHQQSAGIQAHAPQALVPAVAALVGARSGARAEAVQHAEGAQRTLVHMRAVAPWLRVETTLVLGCAWAHLGERAKARALLREAEDLAGKRPDPFTAGWLVRLREAAGSAAPGDGEELTPAELRTLEYLPTHLSLREIGERLYVTRNTVKTHTISIYRKLAVASRSEAVERARELGMLD